MRSGHVANKFTPKLKPVARLQSWVAMAELKSLEAIRAELAQLIMEAVPEPDPARRKGLLTLADHWSDILRRRRAQLEKDLKVRPDGG